MLERDCTIFYIHEDFQFKEPHVMRDFKSSSIVTC
jgi:hypothetical protein